MNWLLSAFRPIFQWLLSFGLQKIIAAIKHYIEENEKVKQRVAAFDQAKKEVLEASQAKDLPIEEKIRRQEDAFKKLVATVNPRDP